MSILVERNVPGTMRDGTVLRADIYRPAGEGRFPVVLQRTPYSKGFTPFVAATLDPIVAASAGYVVVIQDVRGRFASEGGPFYPYRNEFEDGYDSVEWAAQLPYSDGNVGMYGVSYMGMTQWQAATMQPPHLKAIAPDTAAGDFYLYRGGALELGLMLSWTLGSIGPDAVLRAKRGAPEAIAEFLQLVRQVDTMEEAFKHLPLQELAALGLGDGFAQFLREILQHDTYDDFHEALSVRHKHGRVQVPAMILAGWYDVLLDQDLNHFTRMRAEAATPEARAHTQLSVGPWAHASFSGAVGELNFGLSASGLLLQMKGDLTAHHLRWFDRWLKGAPNEFGAPVKLFTMGRNTWREEQEWPLARTQYTPWYLHSAGQANTRHGDGTLSPVPPGEESPDKFCYDPADPVPTRGGSHLMPPQYQRGPLDQTLVEERSDVLVYTSAPLEKDLDVTGPIVVKLFAATTAPDTDFTAKLVDLYPDGRAINVADGIIRARYREGRFVPPSPITPGQSEAYTIELGATSILFPAGHRIRVEIASSNFPRHDRNPNTGALAWDSDEMQPAWQTIFHDPRYPSHILLPVIP